MAWNGHIRCVDNRHNIGNYTIGKVYEIVDGIITTDNGMRIGGDRGGFMSFQDFQRFSGAIWEEVGQPIDHDSPYQMDKITIDRTSWETFVF